MWNELTLFEQLSNIDGDVERLISSHEKYKKGESEKDNALFYLERIKKLVKMIILDSKNSSRGYMAVELYDEIDEIEKYISGEYSADYIRNYWNQYTKAIS